MGHSEGAITAPTAMATNVEVAYFVSLARPGASLVQLYSAMVYDGPGIARSLAEGLADRLEGAGYANISEAVGTG